MAENTEPVASFDWTRARAESVGLTHGLTVEDQALMDERIPACHKALTQTRDAGGFGFARLPFEDPAPVEEAAREISTLCDHFVVLGIGGSALGGRALLTAMLPAFPARNRPFSGPRVHIVDNVDPAHLAEFYGHLPLDRTVFNVITKSGGTPETVTQFLIARRLLEDAQPKDFHRRIWITTDPEKGDLRDVARDEGFPTLPVPSDVGGRFSVLSPVGLLPACVAGVDIRALLDGSADFDAHWRAADPRDNPAYRFAAVNWVLHRRKKKSIVVLLSYSQKLYDVADWFRQLWAESLGKRLSLLGEEVFAGTTPVRALGTTDQHSQIQLYTEGPNDKFIIFLRLEEMGGDLEIPALYPDRPSLAYLGGHRVSELFHAEFLGTETALVEADRPSARLTLPVGNPRSLGWLLQMLQTATVAAGHLYGVNPFDQPGVERGKVVAAALLGKPGLEDLRRELS